MKRFLLIAVFAMSSILTVGSMTLRANTGAGSGAISEMASYFQHSPLKVSIAHAEEAPAVAEAPAAVQEPVNLNDVAQLIPTLVGFAKNGQWLLFGALLSMVMTFMIRQFVLPKISLGAGVLPLVSGVLGVLSGVGGAVYMGATPIAALLAVMSGPAGSWLWSALAKHFFPAAPKGL